VTTAKKLRQVLDPCKVFLPCRAFLILLKNQELEFVFMHSRIAIVMR